MDEFAVYYYDGRKRRLFARDFDEAAQIADSLGLVQSMDYIDCLWNPNDPEFLPVQCGNDLGIYG